MKIIIIVLYALAGLTALNFVLSVVMLFYSTLQGAFSSVRGGAEELTPAVVLGGLFLLLLSFLFHGVFVITYLAAAESIRIIIDIQRNTQETAYYAQQSRIANT